MTIHKSQGSGYVNVAVVLSEKQDSPLLNRQILYTAITRANCCQSSIYYLTCGKAKALYIMNNGFPSTVM